MKKAIIFKNIDSSWACQNRVEALQDWARGGGNCPFDIEVENNNAVVIITDDLSSRYDNNYQYESDINMLNTFLRDIKDPIEAGDNFEYKEIDIENSTAEQQTEFTKFAHENIGPLSCEYLSVLGLNMGARTFTEKVPDNNNSPNRMEMIDRMLHGLSMESSNDIPDTVTLPAQDTKETAYSEPKIDADNDVGAENDVQPPVTTDLPHVSHLDEDEHDFIKEFKAACDEYEITPKGLVAVIMSLKALANNTAKAKPFEDTDGVTVDDVTSKEEYNYTDAVPYINNPAESGESTQFTNVGTESINDNTNNNETEESEPEVISADDIYGTLTNVPTGTIFEDNDMLADSEDEVEVITADIGLEAFMSKHARKHDSNQVIDDMKKICEDVKDIAIKSFRELRNRNTELFEKYGSFIKLINDITDAIFMDKHYVKLEIARFDVRKANNEIVPDGLEESIRKYFGKTLLNRALGPFAGLAQDADSPGNNLLICANKLRERIVASAKKSLSKYPNTIITMVEDELKGSYVLTLAFAPLEISNESEEKKYNSLIEQYAFESSSDDEFFQKVIENKDKFEFQDIMDCTTFNMRNFYVNGTKVQNNPAVAAVRRTAYFKN